MKQYEIYKSEGGYRVAKEVWYGAPVVSYSPWFATFIRALKWRYAQVKRDYNANTMDGIPRTVAEARANGWVIKGYKTAYQRGYVSHKTIIDNQQLMIADGSRAGEVYYLAPCYTSTQYCYRVYISKE